MINDWINQWKDERINEWIKEWMNSTWLVFCPESSPESYHLGQNGRTHNAPLVLDKLKKVLGLFIKRNFIGGQWTFNR